MSHHSKSLSAALAEMIPVCLWTSVKAHTIVQRRLCTASVCLLLPSSLSQRWLFAGQLVMWLVTLVKVMTQQMVFRRVIPLHTDSNYLTRITLTLPSRTEFDLKWTVSVMLVRVPGLWGWALVSGSMYRYAKHLCMSLYGYASIWCVCFVCMH